MGLLNGQLAQAIYAGFQGKLLRGTLRQSVGSVSGGTDDFGDAAAPTIVTYPCEGFTDRLSSVFKGRAGIPETDSQVNIFAASLPAGVVPGKDDLVQMPAMTGPWWQLRAVATDPATALWIAAAFIVRAPA